ncbi:MAG: phage head closure protein [Chitinispirillales bacterium]|nr:phage head closure protein [Chitinispirillales bacterium]
MNSPQKYKSRSTNRRHRITVVRTTRTNDRGVVKTVDEEVGTYWSSVTPLTEQLRIQYQTMNVKATHAIGLDGRVMVEEKDKIKFGDRVFEILTIKRVDELDRDQVLITEEIRPK